MDLRNQDGIWELLFADDLAIIADTEEELQERYLEWKSSLERGGLKVNTSKTEVMISSREGIEDLNVMSQDGER